MPTNVTVLGAAGTTVTIPYTSTALATQVQAALTTVSSLVTANVLTQQNYPGGSSTVPAGPIFTGSVVTVAANNNLGILPSNAVSLIDTSPSITAAIGAANTTVVATGPNAQFVYQNQATNANIFLAGGINYIKEAFGISAANISVDASTTVLGSGAAIIDNSVAGSSATVNAFANSLVDVIPGGNVQMNAGVGTVVLQVSGGSTIPVTITGTGGASSQIDYIPTGGNAFIQPGAESIVVLDNGIQGSTSLFGGTLGNVTAPAFTGTATVFGGTGFFQGGSAGGNSLTTSTLAGGATLLGGGSGDTLTAYGIGDKIVAGSGNETLIGANGQKLLGSTVVAPSGGANFLLGSGANFLSGDISGGDTIGTGTGTATINLGHSTGPGSIIKEIGAGGSVTINGFASKPFTNNDSFVLASGVTASITSSGSSGAVTSVATLSDGTKVTFVNAFQAITNVGGTLA